MANIREKSSLQKSRRLKEHEKELAKRKKNALISSVILGGQDGVVNVLGVLLAVASATYDPRIVIIAGVAAAFTESVSMLAVAYTSARAQEDYYRAEEERELKEIDEMPEIEREEVTRIYYEKGFRGRQLESIVNTIASNKDIWKEVMMREELGLEKVDIGYARKAAGIVGISVVIGSVFPLVPFLIALPQVGLLSVQTAAWLAAISSISALFIAGFIKAKLTTGVPWRSGLEMAVVGGMAALLGYVVGSVLRVTV
ncbi:MAG TPA: VIT1/CCC1 transporter family protein [Candidatus Norongarragalinales archaeon]|nr:VIT1/CCC1 transporter family protein [Candidatus Norongarragalinales archaeon]